MALMALRANQSKQAVIAKEWFMDSARFPVLGNARQGTNLSLHTHTHSSRISNRIDLILLSISIPLLRDNP